MAKVITFKKGLLSVLFWSIISAAFIGPGTVTTAASAGAGFKFSLLWALVFSTLATIVLQEAAARITIASGKNLGEIIALRYHQGGAAARIRLFLFLSLAFGCAAYQAGNILGAISGLLLFLDIPRWVLTLMVAGLAGVLLWIGNFRMLANILGAIVAIMGIAFVYSAWHVDLSELALQQLFLPAVPEGSLVLVLGLIGTTIVPYNLFLASGISQGQSITEMRLGISMAVLIGGIISIAIMLVGTQISGTFSFEALAAAMSNASSAGGSGIFFGIGLFAAGLSSAITSPLAAAVTAQSLFSAERGAQWGSQSRNFRLVWGSVLSIGLIFGLLDFRPIPVIILAQALNGLLLPVIAIFLILAVNDKRLLPSQYCNTFFSNLLMLAIVGITCYLGFNNLWKALSSVINLSSFSPAQSALLLLSLDAILIFWIARIIFSQKNKA
jgi:Mn2+/Fe2+ NRAMP family transporter